MCAMGVCYGGLGALSSVEKGAKIDPQTYLHVVKDSHHPGMRILFGDGAAFLRDGASSHAAQVAMRYLADNRVELLEPRPANSPNLNNTDYAIRGTSAKGAETEKPVTEIDPKVAVRRALSALELGVFRKSIEQFERRLDVCIEGEGEVSE